LPAARSVIPTDRAYKSWSTIVNNGSTIFNNDSTLASALLDRLLDHAETVAIEGKGCRTNEDNESSPTMDLDQLLEPFFGELPDQTAAQIADFLMQLALCFESTYLSQIRRHHRAMQEATAYDPNQLDLFDPF
jgi:IstB-like ATP binding protein